MKKILITAVSVMLAVGCFSGCGSSTKAGTKTTKSDNSSSTATTSSVAVVLTQSYKIDVEVGVEYTVTELAKLVINSDSSSDNSGISYSFKDGVSKKTFSTPGKDEAVIMVNMSDGSQEEWTLDITVADTTAPVFEGIKDISVDEDAQADLKSGVSVKDNYDKSVEFTAEIDPEDEAPNAIGEHTVIYTAKDSSGNEATETAKLTIKQVFEETDKYMYVNADTLATFESRDLKTETGLWLNIGDKVHVTAKVKDKDIYRIEVDSGVVYVDSTKLSDEDPTAVTETQTQVQPTQQTQQTQQPQQEQQPTAQEQDNTQQDNSTENTQNDSNSTPATTEAQNETTEPEENEESTTNNQRSDGHTYYIKDEPGMEVSDPENWVYKYGDPYDLGYDYNYWYNTKTGTYRTGML